MSVFSRVRAHLTARQLLRNTLWVLAAQGMRLVLQAVYFVIIARRLGAAEYGTFVGACSLVGVAAPFAGLGAGNLLIKNVARQRELLGVYCGNALVLIAASSVVLMAAICAISHFALPTIPLWTIVCVCLSDLLFSRCLEITAQSFQALEELKQTANFFVAQSVLRVIAACALLALPSRGTAPLWSLFYLSSTAAATVYAIWVARRRLRPLRIDLRRIRGELAEGMHFSISLSAQTIYNNIDKALLARMVSVSVVGFYAAAYRIVELSFLPINSLLMAGYARFFQRGQQGLAAAVRHALTLLPKALAYSAAVSAVLYFAAPVLPRIFGTDFASSVIVMRCLALLPLLKAFSYFAADSLTGAGHQGLRSAIQAGIAVFNFLLTVWWIHASSWMGAVWASLVSDAALGAALWIAIAALLHTRRPEPVGALA